MSEQTTIKINGQSYTSAKGGCADCDLDTEEVQEGCFLVPKLTGERGCCCGKCWKIVKTTACNV